MRRHLQLSLFVLLIFIASLASAQVGIGLPGAATGGLNSAPSQATITGTVESRNGDEVHGTVAATIAAGWHVNSNKPLNDFSIPTVLTLDPATAELVTATYPPHVLKSFAFSGNDKLAVYEGTIQIPFVAKLKSGATSIKAALRYQACSDSVCLPPKTATTEIALTPGAQVTAATGTSTVGTANGGFTPLTAAPKGASTTTPSSGGLLGSDIGATFSHRGLPLTLLVIFVLGLALNLTPCVYPLIPITIGFFSQQSGGSRGQRVALSSFYVLGLATTYSALGVVSALSGRLFGAWLQLPAVLIFFALLMLVMASSMFGLFDISVPHFISDRSGGRAGLLGALTMGLLIGIVAAPCVGPFVVSLIALVSQLGSPLLGFLMFFVLALGLGVPYLLLGIFSSGLNAIPRSGMWMVQVKKAMGFVLIAMAFYFLRPLIGDEVFRWGVAGSLLLGAALLLLLSRTPGGKGMRLACGVLLLVGGLAFALPHRAAGTALQWDAYDEKALAAAAAAHKPVVIDFYADWCMPCRELDEKTFPDPKVVDELGRFVRIKANLTVAEDPRTQQLAKQYGIVGVPTLVFIDANGQEHRDLRLNGFETAETFVPRLKQVQ